jgi:hypothetical protein
MDRSGKKTVPCAFVAFSGLFQHCPDTLSMYKVAHTATGFVTGFPTPFRKVSAHTSLQLNLPFTILHLAVDSVLTSAIRPIHNKPINNNLLNMVSSFFGLNHFLQLTAAGF